MSLKVVCVAGMPGAGPGPMSGHPGAGGRSRRRGRRAAQHAPLSTIAAFLSSHFREIPVPASPNRRQYPPPLRALSVYRCLVSRSVRPVIRQNNWPVRHEDRFRRLRDAPLSIGQHPDSRRNPMNRWFVSPSMMAMAFSAACSELVAI